MICLRFKHKYTYLKHENNCFCIYKVLQNIYEIRVRALWTLALFQFTMDAKGSGDMYKEWNPSPSGARVGDCAVRAIARAFGTDWETAYLMLCIEGLELHDIPNSNAVIAAMLKKAGYSKHVIPDTCPDCYTIADFAEDHKAGTYILGTGNHIVSVVDGDIYDSWDSSHEIPITYWEKNIERR